MNFGKALDKLNKGKCDFIYSEDMEDGDYVYCAEPYTDCDGDVDREVAPSLMYCNADNLVHPWMPDNFDLIGYRDWMTGKNEDEE